MLKLCGWTDIPGQHKSCMTKDQNLLVMSSKIPNSKRIQNISQTKHIRKPNFQSNTGKDSRGSIYSTMDIKY